MEKFYEDTDIVTVVIVTDRNRVEKQMYAHMARQLLEYVIKDHICARATFNGSDHNNMPFSFDVGSAAFAVYLKDDEGAPAQQGTVVLNVVYERHHVQKRLPIEVARCVIEHAQKKTGRAWKPYYGADGTECPFKFEVGLKATSVYAN